MSVAVVEGGAVAVCEDLLYWLEMCRAARENVRTSTNARHARQSVKRLETEIDRLHWAFMGAIGARNRVLGLDVY